jgi:hypothetical protein
VAKNSPWSVNIAVAASRSEIVSANSYSSSTTHTHCCTTRGSGTSRKRSRRGSGTSRKRGRRGRGTSTRKGSFCRRKIACCRRRGEGAGEEAARASEKMELLARLGKGEL